jgi:hypothetical protein
MKCKPNNVDDFDIRVKDIIGGLVIGIPLAILIIFSSLIH